MSRRNYIIAKPFYGFGGNLSVLACAWIAAKKLNRWLIVDWRGMNYGGKFDYFQKLFKPLPYQVPISEIADMESAVFPHYWSEFVRDIPQQQKGYNLTAANPDLLFDPESGFSAEDHSIAVVARDGRFFHRGEYKEEIREFFAELKPVDKIDSDISTFRAKHFENFTIGVHFRHGNGEATVVPPDFDWFCRSIDELSTSAPDYLPQVFIATDCGAALDMFRVRYGDRIVSYPKIYLPNGTGGMHYQQTDNEKLKSAVEALIDIRLLSLCNAFVGTKSFFSASANHWGQGFNRMNSRSFVPRLRSYKPEANQTPVSTDPQLMAVFGANYPVDNLYFDRHTCQLFFQDILVGDRISLLANINEVELVKQKIFRHRLY